LSFFTWFKRDESQNFIEAFHCYQQKNVNDIGDMAHPVNNSQPKIRDSKEVAKVFGATSRGAF